MNPKAWQLTHADAVRYESALERFIREFFPWALNPGEAQKQLLLPPAPEEVEIAAWAERIAKVMV